MTKKKKEEKKTQKERCPRLWQLGLLLVLIQLEYKLVKFNEYFRYRVKNIRNMNDY